MKDELLINGFENEKIIANALNGKHFSAVNPLFNEMLCKLYGNLKDDDLIEAKVNYGLKKYDLVIKIKNKIKRISVKKGVNNSVHAEPIEKFIIFLKELNIDNNYINNFLEYFYADGTLNGTGKNRKNVKEYKELNQDKIDQINVLLNTEEIVKKCIDRFILQGWI